ncbi:MAG: Dihydrofolate synthase/folylpolyglutamate synthase [Gammaproteobacteria bacterium]|nr:Dihydrofolate synthase/folylpolyglutamate synthase [Gammaproteobacteria bacterium]
MLPTHKSLPDSAPLTANRLLEDWLAYIRTVHIRSIDMTLDRVRTVLQRLVVRLSFDIVAVAGTNGKGSCAAMLGAILHACGYKTAVYTSPHLVRFNERVRIAGIPVNDTDLCRAFQQIESARGDTPLTYFEFATLAAVLVFQQYAVDIAVMEVGMGGRLDAVNALPIDAALITNVELDHVRWLGGDREAIGREKAHIMRGERPSVYNDSQPPGAILDYAASVRTRLLVAGRDYRHESIGGRWRWFGPNGETWALEPPPMPGAVQIANAAGVLALLACWKKVRLERETAVQGLRDTRIRGRCEIVSYEPLVILDVAHNPSAVEILARQLAANPVTGKTTAVFGMLKDKDPAGIVRTVEGYVDTWCLATIRDERGTDAWELANLISGLVRGRVHCHASAKEAYKCALIRSCGDDRVVGFGSFYIAGDILDYMARLS